MFSYKSIANAWAAINGKNSEGRYFYIAQLFDEPFEGGGKWMAFLRRSDHLGGLIDVPFGYEGFAESADAEEAVNTRAYRDLGWRIEEIEVDKIPESRETNKP